MSKRIESVVRGNNLLALYVARNGGNSMDRETTLVNILADIGQLCIDEGLDFESFCVKADQLVNEENKDLLAKNNKT